MDSISALFATAGWSLSAMSPDVELVLRLAVAALLGGLIGMERGVHGRSAGMRTQMLVAVGSALAMVVSLHFAKEFGQAGPASTVRVDPARMAYGVMGGVGFLGAGAMMRFGVGIRGMTTAASLWCTAAVGLASGFGMFFVAISATALALFALVALRVFDRILPRPFTKQLTVVTSGSAYAASERLGKLLAEHNLSIADRSIRRNIEQDTARIELTVTLRNQTDLDKLIRLTDEAEGILRA